MDNVDSIAMLRQEPAEPSRSIEEVAEECDHAQAHSDCEGGVYVVSIGLPQKPHVAKRGLPGLRRVP